LVLNRRTPVLLAERIVLAGYGVREVAVLDELAEVLQRLVHARQQAEHGDEDEQGSGEATEHGASLNTPVPACPQRLGRHGYD
jgi:hypothetical protein